MSIIDTGTIAPNHHARRLRVIRPRLVAINHVALELAKTEGVLAEQRAKGLA
jgi:hypothetical protein